MSIGNFKLHFGKHIGKTLNEIYSIDKRYLTWIQKEFKPGTVLDAVNTFLNDDPNLELNFDSPEARAPEDWNDYGIPDDDPWQEPEEQDENERSIELWEEPGDYNGEDIPF